MHPLVVVFRIGRTNRYSFLAIEAGMEANEGLAGTPVVHSPQRDWRGFFQQLDPLLWTNRIVLIAYSVITAHAQRLRARQPGFLYFTRFLRFGQRECALQRQSGPGFPRRHAPLPFRADRYGPNELTRHVERLITTGRLFGQ